MCHNACWLLDDFHFMGATSGMRFVVGLRVQSMSIDITKLRDLSVADKLRIVTQLWDDIAASADPIVVPPEVLTEASRRSEELNADPSVAIGDNELWQRVDG